MKVCVLLFLIALARCVLAQQQPCCMICDNQGGETPESGNGKPNRNQGPPGQRGPQGPKGERGPACECDCSALENVQERMREMSDTRNRFENLPTSCAEIRNSTGNTSRNGIHYVRDSNDIMYPVYCDMSTDGGGWTLVATVHENNIRRPNGRCSGGDKWSSESGNHLGARYGAEAWFNYATFGNVISATSEDYKNPAYFDIEARNVMIWQVPNDTPLPEFESEAYLRSGTYAAVTDNGPAIPITFDLGSASELRIQYGPNVRSRTDAGFLEFRAINGERNAYALCPGLRARTGEANVEHHCIGSTADNNDVNYCGDFASLNFDNFGSGTGWNADLMLLQSTFMIFYR